MQRLSADALKSGTLATLAGYGGWKSTTNRTWSGQGSIDFLICGVLVEGQKTFVFDLSLVRKIGPNNAPEAPTRPWGFARAPAPGGMGPWSGPACEVKLNFET